MTMQGNGGEGRFEPYVLEPGAPSAFACFGTWENVRTCGMLGESDDPMDGCSQSAECRRYTLEQNPPTTRFHVKPRRDGRFEVQQFRDFIREQTSYHMDITEGRIEITYPGKRAVPKSKRFFLHVKHLEEANLPVEIEFELIMSLEKMVLRKAGPLSAAGELRVVRQIEEDPEARRRRIAEKLRKKASEAARAKDNDEELDIDIDLDIDDDDDDDDDDLDIEGFDDDDDDDDDDETPAAADDDDDDDDTAADDGIDLDDDELMVDVDDDGDDDDDDEEAPAETEDERP